MQSGSKTLFRLFLIAGIFFFSQAGVIADVLGQVPDQPSGDYGYYQVGSSPNGADVVFDGRFVGETPITVPVFSSSTPGHTISVSKIGYITWTESYSQNPVAGQRIPVFAPLQPTEATGSIQVISSPTGALVNLDGTMGQMSPWIYTSVPVGGHVIQAFLSGFTPYSGPVEVVAGQTTEVTAYLYPLTSTGALQVVTSPGGADLYIDDIYKGKTSTVVGSIATGTHVVVLKHYGYQDINGKVIIEEGTTTYLSFTLVPFTEPTTGNIRISSDPAGAGIYIDGTYNGVTHAGELTTFTGIAPGPHSVELKLSNYQGYSETVEIVAGMTSTISANLAGSPNPAPYASVEIISVPSGASVFLDNALQGITPLTLPSVPVGKHTLSIRMTGYSDYSTMIQLSPGQSALISAALTPVPTPTPAATTPSGMFPVTAAPIIAAVLVVMNSSRVSGKK
ncbi:MAG: PEGA domain-containing protein [Methanomicrobiales archaeon]